MGDGWRVVRRSLVGAMRRVVCAAIRADDDTLLLGIRHYSLDMVDQIRYRLDWQKFMNRTGDDQGFVDQQGVYMKRAEAYQVAYHANQLQARRPDYRGPFLYSEDLY